MTETVLTEPAVEPPTRRSPARRLPWQPPVWWPLALGSLLGALCGGLYGTFATPEYTATSYVVVASEKSGDPAMALGYAHAYGRVSTGGAVLGDATEATGDSTEELRASVQSVTSPDAPMIEITGTDTKARHAATIANEVARALTDNANASTDSNGVRLRVFAKAVPPGAPTSPSAKIATAVGICAGGLLGGLLLLVSPGGRRRAATSRVPAPAREWDRPDTEPATPDGAATTVSTAPAGSAVPPVLAGSAVDSEDRAKSATAGERPAVTASTTRRTASTVNSVKTALPVKPSKATKSQRAAVR